MKTSTHLSFDGRCREAFALYQELTGGQLLTMLAYGKTPMAADVPADWQGKIVHATMLVGELELSGADVTPAQYQRPQGFYLLLHPETPAEAERVFAALSEGGQILQALQQTFWSPCFGVVVDRFGIPWEVSCASAQQPAKPA